MTAEAVRRILGIGKDARFDSILDAFTRSKWPTELYAISEVDSPGIRKKVGDRMLLHKTDDRAKVREYALSIKPHFAIISPEEPLLAGVVDELKEIGVPCVGPTQAYAQLETSKAFTRNLLSKYNIPGNIDYRVFGSMDGLEAYLRERGEFVVKPDGLTAGKGVKVFGEHLHSIEEAMEYASSIFRSGHPAVVIEEKLDGEEFSFQSFCDGRHVAHTVAVQDHKRAFVGDKGPNTGGMGSYSCENHSLPFLTEQDIQLAGEINSAVAEAIQKELGGDGFKGILYGGFIVTKRGLRVLEYNARFGDPEAMNVLPLLNADFVDVCEAIINGTLDQISVTFAKKATVCKYVVPEGYPDQPKKEAPISGIPEPSDNLKVYYAAVNQKEGAVRLTGSRAIAVVGIGNRLSEAEKIAEDAANMIKGPVRHRKDIGTSGLIQKRIDHVRRIKNEALRLPESRTMSGNIGLPVISRL